MLLIFTCCLVDSRRIQLTIAYISSSSLVRQAFLVIVADGLEWSPLTQKTEFLRIFDHRLVGSGNVWQGWRSEVEFVELRRQSDLLWLTGLGTCGDTVVPAAIESGR